MGCDKNVVCRGCAKSYQKKIGISGRYCSNECKVKYPKNRDRCKPHCSPNTLYIQEVTFKNGVIHSRQSCRLCRVIKYVPRGTSQIESVSIGIKTQSKEREDRYGSSFYSSRAWLTLRYRTFRKYGKRCMVCGVSQGVMHVDHIKPRSKYPEMELDASNLQVMCQECNLGKGADDETDWRSA